MTELRELSPKQKFSGIIEDNARKLGKKLYGEFTILENTKDHMKIKTALGVIMTIPHRDVKEWKLENGSKGKDEKAEKRKEKVEARAGGDEKDDREGKGKQKQQKGKKEKDDEEGGGKIKPEFEMNFQTINKTKVADEEDILKTIEAGIKNLWLVGPAGCGKTVMSENVGKRLGKEVLLISCGLGTSATEFMGYKYPEREATPFQEYYKKNSLIILDEFTALDPSVAQVANSALANGILNTTTGLVRRHEDCIIIATSNTFGSGANRQYVSNNQLDASTIDRFVGGILEVNYSAKYEERFDKDVVTYVNMLRQVIVSNSIRKVASTRMVIEGEKLKKVYPDDWWHRLISNWSANEVKLIEQHLVEPVEVEKKSNAVQHQITKPFDVSDFEKAIQEMGS